MNVTSAIAFFLLTSGQQEVRLTGNTRITTDARIAPGTYVLPNDSVDGQGASIVISADDVTVDFQGAVIRGTPETTEPDERKGVAVLVTGDNVTIKNLNAHGYKIAVMGRDANGLKIFDCDFSYNWKQRLKSRRDKEDLSDWMSFHQNEKDEWLRFGGGIYLRNCDNFEVRGTRIVGGQCGLMMTECDGGLVWNNDFSYLSALGIGMYRSSENRIMHNKVDYCVRGYSHGVYNRGQDSAGILIYEQSHRNVFAYNSVTHGGDGFFLWAGQTTMDTGRDGCNDNLLFGNDFSHAPTNGIEATFSRNRFVNNLMLECWHGVWGGYSYDSEFLGNVFGYNAEGIALEHGQDNQIEGNRFIRDRIAIYLWMNPNQDPNWGYPKYRYTDSDGYSIRGNIFQDIDHFVFRFRDTKNIDVSHNLFIRSPKGLLAEGQLPGFRMSQNHVHGRESRPEGFPAGSVSVYKADRRATAPPTMQPSGNVLLSSPFDPVEYRRRFNVGWDPFARGWRLPETMEDVLGIGQATALAGDVRRAAPIPLAGGMNPFLGPNDRRGRRTIIVDEWGPYDYRRPILWPRLPVTSDGEKQTQVFEVLGPRGRWRLISHAGCEVSATSGQVPGQIVVTTSHASPSTTLDLQMEYVGEATTDYRGIVTRAGVPVRFGFREVFVPIAWTVNFYTWEKETSDPRTQEAAFRARLGMTPAASFTTNRLEIAAGGSPRQGVPNDYWATVATGRVNAQPGNYRLKVTTDDGVRIWVNGRLVIDQWKYQGPTDYQADVVLRGNDEIKVEHFEIDGYAALKVELEPR